jgi:hypothetical protein
MTKTCIDPSAITEGDLIRFVDGEAEDAIVDHVGVLVVKGRKYTTFHPPERSYSPGAREHRHPQS